MTNAWKRVLVVESNPLMAMELIELIESLDNVSALLTSDAASGQDIATVSKIDGAILNIQNQSGAWRALADALSRLGIPWIFVSGYKPEVLEGDYAHIPYVEKPFTAQQVRSLVAEMLRESPVMPVAIRPCGHPAGADNRG